MTKTKINIQKLEGFTIAKNTFIRDTNLSCKAIGLMLKMISLPPDWDYTVEGLVTICKDGRDAIKAALRELEDHGYLTRRQLREKGKFLGNEYYITQEPQGIKPQAENPPTVNPPAEKPTQYNKDILNDDEEEVALSSDFKTLVSEDLKNKKEISSDYLLNKDLLHEFFGQAINLSYNSFADLAKKELLEITKAEFLELLLNQQKSTKLPDGITVLEQLNKCISYDFSVDLTIKESLTSLTSGFIEHYLAVANFDQISDIPAHVKASLWKYISSYVARRSKPKKEEISYKPKREKNRRMVKRDNPNWEGIE